MCARACVRDVGVGVGVCVCVWMCVRVLLCGKSSLVEQPLLCHLLLNDAV